MTSYKWNEIFRKNSWFTRRDCLIIDKLEFYVKHQHKQHCEESLEYKTLRKLICYYNSTCLYWGTDLFAQLPMFCPLPSHSDLPCMNSLITDHIENVCYWYFFSDLICSFKHLFLREFWLFMLCFHAELNKSKKKFYLISFLKP